VPFMDMAGGAEITDKTILTQNCCFRLSAKQHTWRKGIL